MIYMTFFIFFLEIPDRRSASGGEPDGGEDEGGDASNLAERFCHYKSVRSKQNQIELEWDTISINIRYNNIQ